MFFLFFFFCFVSREALATIKQTNQLNLLLRSSKLVKALECAGMFEEKVLFGEVGGKLALKKGNKSRGSSCSPERFLDVCILLNPGFCCMTEPFPCYSKH